MTRMRLFTICLLCAASTACGPKIPEPETVAAEPRPAALDRADAPAPPEPKPAQPETFKQREPEPGFNLISHKDTLPICVFPSMTERVKAPYLKDVKPQKLAANSKVTFGVYGPWCLNEACDDRPTLQCWTEQDGDTIVVKTRFSSFHNDAVQCTDNCMDLDTSCDSQLELAPGKHSIRHGDKTYTVKVPGTLKDPCFGAK
jgi:hypothetical protein